MDLITHLTTTDRERLMAEGDVHRLAAGEYLLRQGQPGGDIYLVESGRLEVVDVGQTPEVILDVLTEGSLVGEMAFIDQSDRAADVRALDETTVRHWRRASLLRMLEGDPSLGARFYAALTLIAVERLRTTDANAIGMAGVQRMSSLGGVSAAVAEEAREIAAVARGVWSRVEQVVRSNEHATPPLHDAEAAMLSLVEATERWLGNVSSIARAQEAGAVLRTELRPWLIRSQAGLIALDRRGEQGARLSFLAHLLLNRPEGTDVIGERLDAVMLALPTPTGLRVRLSATVDEIVRCLPGNRPAKITIIQPSCGALLARLIPRLITNGATIRCIDGDPQTLAFVDSGLQARPAGIQIEMVHEDLVSLSEGQPTHNAPLQDVVVLNGLVDHLPSRLVGSLLHWCRGVLRSNGRVLLMAMRPTSDARAMDHLLGWPLVRRTADDLMGLFAAAGLDASIIPIETETQHGGLVISAKLSANGQD